MQYKLDNEFDLIYVVGYQNIIRLSYIDKLLDQVQLAFRDKYKQDITDRNYGSDYSSFDNLFHILVKKCEEEAKLEQAQKKVPRTFQETDKANKTVASMIEKTDRFAFLTAAVGGSSESSNKSTSKSKKSETIEETFNDKENIDDSPKPGSHAGSPKGRTMRKYEPKPKKDDKPAKPTKKGKTLTKWEDSVNESELDFSNSKSLSDDNLVLDSKYGDKSTVGSMSGELKAIEIQSTEEIEIGDSVKNSSTKASAATSLFSSLKGLVGGKTLTKEMITPVMDKMQEHLIAKNVAAEIAKKLCDNVALNLEGKQIGNFQFVSNIVKKALHDSLVQILTPKRRIDILRDVLDAQRQKRPYVITFCGVNGVGKSTNLAKVAFWLIENGFRILIAACDTFRSGAVEQLRTHTRHLNALHPPEKHNGLQMVQLYEKGYDKEAAGIALEAINHARDSRIDVVLVDTAGRMQDNEPLMRALANLINKNNPDLVLFVGEALVGNEAVDQVRKFNQALVDNANLVKKTEQARIIDGIVLTKFDTIDDKVGAAISMTYTTGQPIVFVGTGQTYADLKNLNAESVVQSLLR